MAEFPATTNWSQFKWTMGQFLNPSDSWCLGQFIGWYLCERMQISAENIAWSAYISNKTKDYIWIIIYCMYVFLQNKKKNKTSRTTCYLAKCNLTFHTDIYFADYLKSALQYCQDQLLQEMWMNGIDIHFKLFDNIQYRTWKMFDDHYSMKESIENIFSPTLQYISILPQE